MRNLARLSSYANRLEAANDHSFVCSYLFGVGLGKIALSHQVDFSMSANQIDAVTVQMLEAAGADMGELKLYQVIPILRALQAQDSLQVFIQRCAEIVDA